MTQLAFGSGAFWGVNSAANSTPVRFGVLQSASIDFSANSKPLFGQNQLPVSVARGAVSVKGKAQFAQLSARLIGELFFSATPAAGQVLVANDEAGTIPASSPYTVTVSNSATFSQDLGVIDATTGLPYVRVASSPTTGQYSLSGGVYTFAAADTGKAVKISYVYTSASTGKNVTITNQPMGQANTFKTVLDMPYAGQKASVTLNACVSSKLSLSTALEDFVKPSMDFDAFVDSAGNLGVISFAEAA